MATTTPDSTGKRVVAKHWTEAEYQKAFEAAHKKRFGELADDTFAAAGG
jgi:hypothetical protein